MKKTLVLLRHAKSDWSHDVEDFFRPLNERGYADAPKMAKRLKGVFPCLDALVVSPAVRTYTTSQYFQSEYQANYVLLPPLYEASVKTFLKEINQLDDSWNTVVMVAHNPTITEMINYLADESISNLPTCGIAILQFDLESWKHVSASTAKLLHLLIPKDSD